MKKKLLFLSVLFFQVCLYAQMQGQLNESSERSVTVNTNDDKSVKTRSYNDSIVISLCRLSAGKYVFTKSKTNSNQVEIAEVLNLDSIIAFRLFGEYIYFCGRDQNLGFVAYSKVTDMFNQGNFILNKTTAVEEIFDLEVYKDPSGMGIKAAALGRDTSSATHFLAYDDFGSLQHSFTPHKAYCMTQTKDFIAVVYQDTLLPAWFGVTAFKKINLNTGYISGKYHIVNSGVYVSQYRCPRFVLANDYADNKIFVSSVVDGHHPNFGGVPEYFSVYGIDLNSGLNMDFAQLIPVETKPFLKDMVYNDRDRALHILAGSVVGPLFNNVSGGLTIVGDMVYDIEVERSNDYMCRVTIPGLSLQHDGVFNSIAFYDGRYYVVAGNKQTGELCWFDKNIQGNNPACASMYLAKVFFNPCNSGLDGINYFFVMGSKMLSSAHYYSYGSSYQTDCIN